MKPLPLRNMTDSQHVFNYWLSRARRVVENVFGITVNRFRCLLTTMPQQPDRVATIALSCCVLHNLLCLRPSSRQGKPRHPWTCAGHLERQLWTSWHGWKLPGLYECASQYIEQMSNQDLGRWPYSLSSCCTISTNNYCDSKRQSKWHDRTAMATWNTELWTNSGRGSMSIVSVWTQFLTDTGVVPVSVKRLTVPCSVYVTRLDRSSRWHAPTSNAATCQHFTCVVSTCKSLVPP